jgi:hypothetical protein
VEEATLIADIPGQVCDKNGSQLNRTTMKDVALVPNGGFNLFSITKMMSKGWKLTGEKHKLMLKKGSDEINFDIAIPTPKGVTHATHIKRDAEVNGAIQQAHDKLGHCGEDTTRRAAKELGWTLTVGTMKPCEACAVGKAKQKNVPKITKTEPLKEGENRIFLDIATVKRTKDQPKVSKPNWRIMADGRTGLKFSDFFQTKDGMVEKTCEQFQKWKSNGCNVNFLSMDNAGGNVLLKQRCESKDWKFNIDHQFAARDTPQQNSLAEVGFATCANRGRAMMARANVPEDIRCKVWTASFKTATLLDGLLPIEIGGVTASRHVHWCGKNPGFAKHLRTWGEAGTVKTKTDAAPKVKDRGIPSVFVGHTLDHPEDHACGMWNPKTGGVHQTRDAIWMKRMFYE